MRQPDGVLWAHCARSSHLRQICVFLHLFLLNQPEVMIGNAAERFDAQGRLGDKKTRDYIRHLLTNLAQRAERLRRFQAVDPG